MWNDGLDEAQAGIKFAKKNITNLRYVDDHPHGRKQRGTKELSWWKWKRRVKKLA